MPPEWAATTNTVPAMLELSAFGASCIGDGPIGWRKLFWNQAKTLPHPLIENKMGPTGGGRFGAKKGFGSQSSPATPTREILVPFGGAKGTRGSGEADDRKTEL